MAIRKGIYEWSEMVNGKRYHESLKVPVGTKADEDAAVRLLRIKQRAVADGHAEVLVSRSKRGTAKLCEVAAVLEDYGITRGMSPRTIRDYISSLYTIVQIGAGVKDPAQASADVLRPEIVERYETAVLAAAGRSAERQMQARNTIASVRNKARSCFSRRARNRMRELILPDSLDDFLRAGDVEGQIVWGLPDPGLVERTKAEALVLRDDGSPLWLVWLLCYGLALRSSEAAWARWSWLRQTPSGWVIDIISRPDEWDGPKGTEGFVPVPDQVMAEFDRLRDGVYILPGESYQLRYWELIQRQFSGWMRGLDWRTNHCAHELRRLRGSEWWTDPSVGPVVCSAWLRHSSLAVTQRHYAKLTAHPAAPNVF